MLACWANFFPLACRSSKTFEELLYDCGPFDSFLPCKPISQAPSDRPHVMAERRTNQEFRQANASIVSAVTVRHTMCLHIRGGVGGRWNKLTKDTQSYLSDFNPHWPPTSEGPLDTERHHGMTGHRDVGKVNPATVIPMCHLHEASAHHVELLGSWP